MKPLCIYHDNCDDGFAAAWAIRAVFGGGSHKGAAGFTVGKPVHVILHALG